MQAYKNGYQHPEMMHESGIAGRVGLDDDHDRSDEELVLARQELDALRQQARELQQRIRELSLLVLTDDLTGLRNDRRFQEELEAARAYANRQNLLLSVIVLELDDFPSFEGTFGQAAGARVLKHMASILATTLRQYDAVARLGGARFSVLLPSTDRTEARGVAERLRSDMGAHDWEVRPMTASFGVTTLECSTTTADDLMEQAQEALARAQQQGGDRVESWQSPAAVATI
jgi:diguanylate cyclase (GGDEF)-like protein